MPRALVIAVTFVLMACASGGRNDAATGLGTKSGPTDAERLTLLWEERTRADASSDFAIGPGDVLEVSVPGLDELERHTVRVSGDGAIALPLVGQLQAEGLTEEELRSAIRERLEAGYMYDPPVNLFVTEYRSRIVGVIGAVVKPGFYPLASESDTLLDALALAGGPNEKAAYQLRLIPASLESSASPEVGRPGSMLPPVAAHPALAQREDAIVIDLDARGDASYLNLPARPGDVILVAERGDVLVKGWVIQPGAYPITPSLTVLGAVAAAGGPHFAANQRTVRVLRTAESGSKLFLAADLVRIGDGEEPDFGVEAGDVIEVSGTPPKMMLAGIYRFIATIFNVGFGIGL